MNKKIIIAIVFLLAFAFLAFAVILRGRFIEEEQIRKAEKAFKKQEESMEEDEDEAEDLDDEDSAEEEVEEREEASGADSFRYDEEADAYYGKLTVVGYATTEQVQEAWCEQNCKTFDYVSFNIIESRNEEIFDYIGGQQGNSFVGEASIGIGCVEDGIIWRYNDSDEFGMQKYSNSPEESKVIISSSENDPAAIELERFLYTGGRGAPDCYSHFAEVHLAE